ncbi:MAG: glycerol-3-phosphate 1-O-acyltransferase PlsY [Elusimicrobia bacterium]|nr:glycerol-3-phosphate 1-O-acyltransferase PlsY [Elusimicrobiota bacterium]
MDPKILWLGAVSYLAGGIPTGYLLAKKLKGIDIREHGSGNPGSANVYRVVGKGAGAATLFVDALKGFFPVLLARHYFPEDYRVQIGCGALAIIGHVWTIFLGFRGGKGVATSAGVFLALLPKPMLGAILTFVIGVALTGHISVGSMAAAALCPVFAWFLHEPWPLTLMSAGAGALILIKHIPNFRRIVLGKELNFQHGSHLEKNEKTQ